MHPTVVSIRLPCRCIQAAHPVHSQQCSVGRQHHALCTCCDEEMHAPPLLSRNSQLQWALPCQVWGVQQPADQCRRVPERMLQQDLQQQLNNIRGAAGDGCAQPFQMSDGTASLIRQPCICAQFKVWLPTWLWPRSMWPVISRQS